MIALAVVFAVLAAVAVFALVRPGRVRAFLTRGAPQLLDIEGRPYHHGLRGLAWLLLVGAVAGLTGSLWPDRADAAAVAGWIATVLLVALGVWFVAAIALRADRQARVLPARRAEVGVDEPVSIDWIRPVPRGRGYGGDIALLGVSGIGLVVSSSHLEPLATLFG